MLEGRFNLAFYLVAGKQWYVVIVVFKFFQVITLVGLGKRGN